MWTVGNSLAQRYLSFIRCLIRDTALSSIFRRNVFSLSRLFSSILPSPHRHTRTDKNTVYRGCDGPVSPRRPMSAAWLTKWDKIGQVLWTNRRASCQGRRPIVPRWCIADSAHALLRHNARIHATWWKGGLGRKSGWTVGIYWASVYYTVALCFIYDRVIG